MRAHFAAAVATPTAAQATTSSGTSPWILPPALPPGSPPGAGPAPAPTLAPRGTPTPEASTPLLVNGNAIFPRMVWRQCPTYYPTSLNAGINLFLGVACSNPTEQFDRLAGKAMSTVDAKTPGVTGPGQVGWTTCGETGQCKQDANNGTLTSGGGSGWAFPPYIIDPLAAIQDYVRAEGPDINYAIDNWDLQSIAFQANHSDTALVFVNAYATEGGDRLNLTLWGNGEEVIRTAARNNNNTVVIIHSPGPVDMNNWVHHENVTAVLYAYYPGQESGSSLPAVLWGEKSPSGKLPIHCGSQGV